MQSKDYCTNYSVALYATDKDQSRLLYSRARCKMWSCEYCASVNRRQWQRRLIEGIKQLDRDEWGFWTLTHDLKDATYEDQRKLLSSAWNRLIGQIKYHTDHEIYFVRAIEIGANATRRMHLHVLINFVPEDLREIKQRSGGTYWYSDTWGERVQKAKFGRIQDIRDVSGTQTYKSPEIALGSDLDTTRAVLTASYITKYMTKTDDATEELFPERTRRFNTSRNFPKLGDEDGFVRYEWARGDKLTFQRASDAWRHRLHVYDVQRDRRINADDFDEKDRLIE